MSSENDNYAVLVEALEAGGYAPAAISNAKVAASRGLGKRTTLDLVAAADPAAGRIAAAIFGSQGEGQAAEPAQMTEEQAKKRFEDDLREAVGFPTSAGDE